MKKENRSVSLKEIHYLEFLNRENNFFHHSHDADMFQYELIKEGNPAAVDEAKKMFVAAEQGHLSDDPLRNLKYLFVAATTLACRFAVEGGMDNEMAHNASDLYIQKMDVCQTPTEITELEWEMFSFFVTQVAKQKKNTIYSKPVIKCMDYIYNHLNEPIHTKDLARHVNLSETYLSALFKKEVCINMTDYIRKLRISAAKNMLKYSDYSYAEISAALAFSNQSYFGRLFKEDTGYTPKEYRTMFFKKSFEE